MCECVIVNGMYHKVKAYILVCACEREEGHPLDTHSFYHLTHSDSCCWGKRRNGSNTTPPNGASHSKQPQFNRERNISFLPFNSACSSRAKRDPDRGQLTHALPHLPHPRYHWDGDYERKEDAGFGSLWLQCSDATANDTFFMHTHRGFTNKTTRLLGAKIQLCILWIIFSGSKTCTQVIKSYSRRSVIPVIR